MTSSPERRGAGDRRLILDRRSGTERRAGLPAPVTIERRSGADRRLALTRRSGVERRVSLATVGEHIRVAIHLLARVVDTVPLSDAQRRELDTALLRLRVALDQLSAEG